MQRGAAIDAHGLRSLLEPLLTRLVVLIVIIVFLLLVAAPGGSFLLFVPARAASLATALLVESLSTVLVLLLVPPFILSLLLLSKQLDLPAVLEIVALGAVDLAVLLAGAPWLVGSRQGPAGDALDAGAEASDKQVVDVVILLVPLLS